MQDLQPRSAKVFAAIAGAILFVAVGFRVAQVPNHLIPLLLGVLAASGYLLSVFLPPLREAHVRGRLGLGLVWLGSSAGLLAIVVGRTLEAVPALGLGLVLALLPVAWIPRLRGLVLAGWALLLCLLLAATPVALQLEDGLYRPSVPSPQYQAGAGPTIWFDEGHNEFHTLGSLLSPLGRLLEADGYGVQARSGPLTSDSLKGVRLLVIGNALHATNVSSWVLPTPSAFSTEEIVALTEWVREGGSLLLIADHMPFAGAASSLGASFGFQIPNVYALRKPGEVMGPPTTADVFTLESGGLIDGHLIRGGTPEEHVTQLASFTGSGFGIPAEAQGMTRLGSDHVLVFTEEAGVFSGVPHRPAEGFYQSAYREFGKGRVVVVGDAAMVTSQLVAGLSFLPYGLRAAAARGNERWVLNVVHWLDRKDHPSTP